jgi:uncharacterized membrane protein YkvA (DUF1232 family)
MSNNNIINYSLLWEKICETAKKLSRSAVRPMLLLYYVLKSPSTPKSEKILIYSALAYVVLPIDIISSKRFPIIGWLDEVVSLTVAYQKVCKHITPEMEREADALLDKWFPEYNQSEEAGA